MKRDLTQLNKVEQYLIDNNIPYERLDIEDEPIRQQLPECLYSYDRHQIFVPGFSAQIREWDVICQRGSYGAEDGLLEIYGSIVDPDAGDSVEGWLTADDVIARIKRSKG